MYWTAGTDEAVEGQWTWVNTRTSPEYTHWAPTEPRSGTRGNCLAL